jgi:cation diffusion facilitator CzcD-associated flavoprotein CzcO/acetyl esterase/lipase
MPHRVVIIGAGFGGIGMAIALKQAGIGDLVVLDRADDLGGTWRDNSYPGLTCDIPSHLYSFSFRPWRWSRRFPARDEILAYLHALAAEHGLGPHLRFGRGVAAAEFDERQAVWNLTLDDGGTLQATAVVCAVGQLGRPALPDIPGRDGFAGPSWHSARWNHNVDLAGRRVAVIGTGASAIQFVPEIAKVAGHVDVYQRSAPYVLPKPDRPYRDAELTVFDKMPVVRKADRLRIFVYGELLTSGFVLSPKLLAGPMQLWRRQLRSQIADPGLRAKCIPDYVMGCKRVVFSNDWYPALARPNVELVTDPIGRIVPDGVVTADGTTRAADVIIYGTGFRTVEFLAPMQVSGLGGWRLQEAWRDGAQAYLGITVCGFPNFFMLYGPNTSLGGNSIIYMLEGQIGYVLGAIRALEAERLAWLDVRPDVQDAFNSWVQSASRRSACVGERLPQLVHHGLRPQHQQLARPHVPVPVPGPALRPRRVPRHAETAGHGRPQRGVSARRARRGLRVPPAVMRLGVRQLGRRCLDPALPWPVQRTRLDQLTRISLLPRGTVVAEQAIGGVRAEVVSARAAGPQPTVIHFHGGGYCVGSVRVPRSWAAHLSARTGCRVVLPEYRLAPEHPHPAALDDARAVMKAVSGEAKPGSVVVSGDSAGGGLALALVLSMRDEGRELPAGCVLLSPWLDLGRDRQAVPDLVRQDVVLTPGWLDACARAYAAPSAWANPPVSPLRAAHAGLPPLLIQAGASELLTPDAELLAASASAAGVDVTYTRWPRMWHDFALQPGLLAAADSALAQTAWFIGKVTARSGSRG